MDSEFMRKYAQCVASVRPIFIAVSWSVVLGTPPWLGAYPWLPPPK